MRGKSVTRLITCNVCKGKKFYDFLDLGEIPIPNGFLSRDELKKKEKRYPLVVTLCTSCYLVQLKYLVNPEIMFKNYLYIPSSSQTRLNHFKELACKVKGKFELKKKSLVIDVGSNDGSLLNCFKNLDVQVLGIDPAENLATIAELNGIPTIQSYFNPQIGRRIVKEYKKASVVTATNVVAHIGDLHEFIKALDIVMDENGVFICQFPYLLDLIQQSQFDTIYHEHLSYFSLKPLIKLASLSNLEIFDIERNDLDGGSIRLYWKKKSNKKLPLYKEQLEKMIKLEEAAGLYEKNIYDFFAKKVKRMKKSITEELIRIKEKNKHIVGYGAAAKGNILLNYFKIGTDIVDYIVDSTPYKQGLYAPGTHIPIYEEAKIYQTNPEYILILAWNFKDEIIQKNQQYKKDGGKFIICVPDLEII